MHGAAGMPEHRPTRLPGPYIFCRRQAFILVGKTLPVDIADSFVANADPNR